jgi:glutamate synthase (ferredoxin)
LLVFIQIQQVTQQAAFGWSSEDVDMQIADMAGTGKETTFSMGDDIPLAVLSQRPHVLYDYFKQRFAQVRLLHYHCAQSSGTASNSASGRR